MSHSEAAPGAETTDTALWQYVADAGIKTLRIPTPFQVGRVNCYLLEDDPLTLIDAGPNSGKALDELEHQVGALGHKLEDIELIVITHQHIDHLGLVDIVARRSGAEVACLDLLAPVVANFGRDAEADDAYGAALMKRHGIDESIVTALQSVSSSFRAWGSRADVTRPLHDGDVLELRDRKLEIQHRPGHSPSDTCFWDAEREILIAADHLIAHISSNPLITRPLDGSDRRPHALRNYIDSLKKTRELPAQVVLPGHGEPIADHVALIDSRFAMNQRRAEKIYRLIAEQPRTGHEVAQELWGNVAVTQAFLTLSEVIGHCDLLIDAGAIRQDEVDGVVHYEATNPDRAASDLGDVVGLPGNPPAQVG